MDGWMRAGFLASQETMTIERIHMMLTLVAGEASGRSSSTLDFSYNMSQMELKRYLQTLVQSDKIDMIDGVYKSISSSRR